MSGLNAQTIVPFLADIFERRVGGTGTRFPHACHRLRALSRCGQTLSLRNKAGVF